VSGGFLTVYPGETVMVEARRDGERLVDLKAVAKISAPERTLVFHLEQEPSLLVATDFCFVAGDSKAARTCD
jgi:hypothetical protein